MPSLAFRIREEQPMAYEFLFKKGKIGPLTIKNRAVMSPMGTEYANHDGTASDRFIAYYTERARGGIGLIINEYTGVDDETSRPANNQIFISRDYHIAPLERLAEAVHAYDCKIFAQLHHGGSTSKAANTGMQAMSASDVPIAPGAPAPRPMTVEEIKRVEQKFVDAAIRLKKAGYDGVELHGAHSYLLGQFFSPYYNKRTDAYGGSFENRMRMISEIIDGIRKALGKGFPISVRICGDEMTPDVPGTLTLEDGLAIGRFLESKGIDAINISNGSGLNGNANCDPYSYTPGWKKHVARAFKQALAIPVIATNTIKDPMFAEELLKEGVCDFVALGRSQLADPEFVNKAKAGRENHIRQCLGCMYCRERLLGNGQDIYCAINARTGREFRYPEYKKDGANRPVAVVGGGPGGMEAARVLALRGYKVTLFEKSDRLGGTLNLACKPRFKGQIAKLIATMTADLEELAVDVRLNTEATPELVGACNPVGVFLASGAEPILPGRIPGIDQAHVCTAEAVIAGRADPAGRIALIGTGMTGLETAETLLDLGKTVTLVEMQDKVGPGIYNVILNDILGRIRKHGPEILTGHMLLAIEKDAVLLRRLGDGAEISVPADSVVLSMGVAPRKGMLEKFEAAFDRVITIGDAAQAGRIHTAIRDGFLKANAF